MNNGKNEGGYHRVLEAWVICPPPQGLLSPFSGAFPLGLHKNDSDLRSNVIPKGSP